MTRNFADIYQNSDRQVISFEVFPPKTEAGMAQLNSVLPELEALSPDFMTVTYGAFGTTQARTLEIASMISRQSGLSTACHLTCVGSSRSEINEILQKIYDWGIRNIVALRGDPPAGETEFIPPPDGYKYANELVEHIRRFEADNGWERVGIAVAGYPEKHVEAPDMETDLKNLKHKVDCGADVVITQLFYDNSDYFRFVNSARDTGINVPIVPGLLPILSYKQIKRIAFPCGASIPDGLMEQLEAAGEDDSRVEEIGIRHCAEQAKDLIDMGVPGIHFYVLNKVVPMSRILKTLRN